MFSFYVNGKEYQEEKDMKLLRFLRDKLHLTSVRRMQRRRLRNLSCTDRRESAEGLHSFSFYDGRQAYYNCGRTF